MLQNLVVCGICEQTNGTAIKKWSGSGFNIELKRPGGIVLGQITDKGNFLIKRGGENYTLIKGSDFEVKCGKCGNIVYRKEVPNGWNYRLSWISWSVAGTAVRQEGTTI